MLDIEEYDPPVEPKPQPVKRKRGRLRKAQPTSPLNTATAATPSVSSAPTELSENDDMTFDLAAHVAQPDQNIWIQGKRGAHGTKTVKVDPIGFGPIPVSISIGWGSFKLAVAELVSCGENMDRLAIEAFRWRLSALKNAPLYTLNEMHLSSMIHQIKLAKPGTGKYIILDMQPPLREQKKKDLPWNNESNQTSSSVQDQQESDSEDDVGPMAKKVCCSGRPLPVVTQLT
ncbi:hypothetical protein V5O48_011806 [Marasmius crinis-equi]|uniref:Uncharacterized protein n=1 Tax=Marasmius crinis-equi TaxID=585013 RepID=A0ABR3F4Y9_9AGAR